MKYINSKRNYSWSKTKEKEYRQLVDDIQRWKENRIPPDYDEWVDENGDVHSCSAWDDVPWRVEDDWNQCIELF